MKIVMIFDTLEMPSRTGQFAARAGAVLLSLFILFCAGPAWSLEIKEVISTGQSWDSFTNTDGTGLYHEILNEVFALYGISVHHEYANSDRAEELVTLNQADMMLCDDVVKPPLVMARYPMYENAYYVFFNKDRIGPWKGSETLHGKTVLSQPGYYAQLNFPVPVNIKYVSSGTQALGMILLGRSDFYVDDMAFIKASIKENTIAYDENEFDIKEAGIRSYHPLFNTSPRGKTVMKLYEDGMMKLHKSGKLRPIFTKWGHPYPDFDNH
jgi:hypothetical protein